MSQTTVNAGGQAAAIAGQLADNSDCDIVSGFNKDTVQIPFGFGVRANPGGAERDCLIATGMTNGNVAGRIKGVNIFSLYHNRAGTVDSAGNYSGDMGASGLLPNSSLEILKRGRVWVPVEQTVALGDPAFCRGIATGALTPGGWLGTNLGGSYTIDCSAQGVFVSASVTAADGSTKVAILEFAATNKPS